MKEIQEQYNNSFIMEKAQIIDDIIDYQEYFLLKDNIINKIIIGKNKNEIFIKCKNYIISFNQIDLSTLFKIKINSLDDAFKFIINIFDDNKVVISKIIHNVQIQLIIEINNKKNIELILIFNKFNKDNYDPIINEINKLKYEINILKKYHENNSPKDIQFLSNIVNDSLAWSDSDNSFTVFKSINDILYLIYSNKNKSIICYDLNEQKNIKELKSVSQKDNNIRIWNVNNWECIQNMTNINNVGWLVSACFIKDNKNINIITSNLNKVGNSEYIKVFDLRGNKIKEINNSNNKMFFNSNDKTYFIDIY